MAGVSKPKLRPEARIGLVGGFLDMVEEQSEADPAALLIDYLATFGNAVGRSPSFWLGGTVHRANIFVVSTGPTSRGRKGVGRAIVRRVFDFADEGWAKGCVVSGHASGEGLISDLSSESRNDPRLFVEEEEFSSTLRVCSRQGAILSEVIRKVWDGRPVSNGRAMSRDVVEVHHVSIIGNITNEELRATLRTTEQFNGFANRFLWVATERSKKLPLGGNLTEDDFRVLGRAARFALLEARKVSVMKRSAATEALWVPWYLAIPDDRLGLIGAATARQEPYVLRLSMIYALMDGVSVIEPEHLRAAWAVWDYCEESARYIFGDSTGHADVDKLKEQLHIAGTDGLTRTRQLALFRKDGHPAGRARERAIQLGFAVEIENPITGGRPEHVLWLTELAPDIGASA